LPVNRRGALAQPVALVGAGLGLTGIYLRNLNGEYVPAS
jgi:hypothetical protein